MRRIAPAIRTRDTNARAGPAMILGKWIVGLDRMIGSLGVIATAKGWSYGELLEVRGLPLKTRAWIETYQRPT